MLKLLYTEYYQHLTAHVQLVVHRILPTSHSSYVRVVAHRIPPAFHSTCSSCCTQNTTNISQHMFELLCTEYYQHIKHMFELLYTKYYQHLTTHVRVVVHKIIPTSHNTCSSCCTHNTTNISQHMFELLYTEYYQHLTTHVRVVVHIVRLTSPSTCSNCCICWYDEFRLPCRPGGGASFPSSSIFCREWPEY